MGEPRGQASCAASAALESEIQARADARWRELAAYFPDYMCTIDRDRRYRWVNRVAPGLTEAQLLSMRLDDFVAPADLPRVARVIEGVFETGVPAEYVTEADVVGESLHFRTRLVRGPNENGEARVMCLTSNITKERRAELALRASEQRVTRMLAAFPDYLIEVDADRRIRFVNRTRPETSEHEVLGQRIDDLAPPELRAEVAAKLDHLFRTGEPVKWTADSVVDLGSYVVHAVRMPGEPACALIVAQDVTREKETLVRLEASEERLARAVHAGNLGLWELDLETGIATGLGWSSRIVGVEGKSVSLDEWSLAMHPEDSHRVSRALHDHVEGLTESYECEYRVRQRSDEPWTHVLDRARLVVRPGGARVVAGTSIDVTAIRSVEVEHRGLERQLEHAQRLESIGLLAGGVAHDFNNLLTVIAAGAECVKRRQARGERADVELEEIVEAVMRAARLTQQLLAFGRRSALDVEEVDVAELAGSVVGMASRVFPKTIEVVLTALPAGAVVRADRHQLEQVLLNLCMNSRDAMPSGGRLTISVELEAEDVSVIVEDTGLGISDADRPRIFEPFFTTKGGAGTGLGLAVAHGIVRQHGGTIEVDSEVGRGSRMRVRLPRHVSRAEKRPERREPARGGHETILVADDEPLVLSMVKRTLEHAGYRVIEARDGMEAVETYEARSGEIDLVLLDVLMPRLDGWRAQQRMRSISPAARVLLTSGYSEAAIPEDVIAGGSVAILSKPYREDTLLRAVRAAIDGDAATLA